MPGSQQCTPDILLLPFFFFSRKLAKDNGERQSSSTTAKSLSYHLQRHVDVIVCGGGKFPKLYFFSVVDSWYIMAPGYNDLQILTKFVKQLSIGHPPRPITTENHSPGQVAASRWI